MLRLDPKTLATTGEVAIASAALASIGDTLYAAEVRTTLEKNGFPRKGHTTVREIEASRAAIGRSLALPDVVIGRLVATTSTLWAVSAYDSKSALVLEIDRAKLEFRARHDLSSVVGDFVAGPMDVAAGDGAIWFGCARLVNNRVEAILLSLRPGDREPTRVLLNLGLADCDEHKMMGLVWGNGQIFASGEKHEPTIAIDPATGLATRVRKVPNGTERPCPLAANADGIWMAASDDNLVRRIDPEAAIATGTLAISAPTAILAA